MIAITVYQVEDEDRGAASDFNNSRSASVGVCHVYIVQLTGVFDWAEYTFIQYNWNMHYDMHVL